MLCWGAVPPCQPKLYSLLQLLLHLSWRCSRAPHLEPPSPRLPTRPPVDPQVKPKQGDALLFFNTHVNGSIDKHSLHGGCPVVAGTKWAMTKW